MNGCNPTWRTIVALSRLGGLRCPSEVLSLRWRDIDWHAGRMLVTSPKTEHHLGRGSRSVPLFPELRAVLEEAFELATPRDEYVVNVAYRNAAIGAEGWKSDQHEDPVQSHLGAGRSFSLAQTVPCLEVKSRNRTRRRLSCPRGRRVTGEFAGDRRQALLTCPG